MVLEVTPRSIDLTPPNNGVTDPELIRYLIDQLAVIQQLAYGTNIKTDGEEYPVAQRLNGYPIYEKFFSFTTDGSGDVTFAHNTVLTVFVTLEGLINTSIAGLFYPVPNSRIEVAVDDTNVYIQSQSNELHNQTGWILLKYTKEGDPVT